MFCELFIGPEPSCRHLASTTVLDTSQQNHACVQASQAVKLVFISPMPCSLLLTLLLLLCLL